MITSVRHDAKRFVTAKLDKYQIYRTAKAEINKYSDAERKAITDKVSLTAGQMKAIDDLYQENYGKKIQYTWHRHYMAYTGNFDEKYFPEHIYIAKFERYMNSGDYLAALSDKCQLPIFASRLGVKTADTVMTVSRNVCRDENYKLLSKAEALEKLNNIGEVYLKISVGSCGGEGCYRADFRDGVDMKTGMGIEESLSGLGTEFVIQKVIETLPKLAAFDNGSAATFRVITYFWRGEVYSCPLTLRIGIHNSPVANAAIIIAIDDDGKIHPEGYSKFGDRFSEHPDSHIKFEGYCIDEVADVICAAKKMHAAIPQIGIINWDFTIDKDGNPVLIEANTKFGSIWLPELVHGKGAFGEKTAEILRWIRFMDGVNPEDRHKYQHGWLPEDI